MEELLCDWCVQGGCTHIAATHKLTYERVSGAGGSMFGCDPHTAEHQRKFTTVEALGGDQ